MISRPHQARIAPAPREQPIALSYPQRRLWFVAQLDPHGSALNAPFVLAFRGVLDVAALHRALTEIVHRHDALRTTFADDDGVPVQRVAPRVEVALPLDDLGALPADQRAAAADQRAEREFLAGFDIAAGPVFRVRLLRLSADDHRLLFVAHHLVWDAWSFAVLVRELRTIYGALTSGVAPALPAVIQYPDFAHWQRTTLDDDALARDRAYWLDRLAGAPPALELPTDRPRPSIQSLRGRRIRVPLADELTVQLREVARKHGATPFMAVAAGLSALLHRYTGADDFVIGTVVAGRTRRDLESAIGMFVNTVPLRIDCAGDPSFARLLARVRPTSIEAFAHQAMPFEQLVERLAPVRDPSRMPLFQILVGQQTPWPGFELPGLAMQADDAHYGASMFDLSLVLQDTDGALRVTWEYSTALFDDTTVRRMHAHWLQLMASALAAPERPLSQLAMLPAAEHAELLAWSTVRTAYPDDQSLPALFAAQVARSPDAPAVVFGEQRLSYAALDARANQLARYLIARGVGREDRVGVCLPRSIDFVVAVLAALKAGACYLPLDPSYPAERLAYMTRDAEARLVIARRDGPSVGADAVVWLDELAGELAGLDAADPPAIASARDLAYVMYTSGSTGAPKGTCIEQRAVARLVLGTDYVTLTRHDVIAQASNTSFDAATFEIWGALLNGATLYGIAAQDLLSPATLARAFVAGGVTTLFVTPAVLHQLAADDPAVFAPLRQLVSGGDVLDPDAVRRIQAAGPPGRLLNAYGPTETTTFATWHEVAPIVDAGRAIPLGRPIANTTVRICDRDRNLVPVGVRGEIYIGGPGVARGYWRRPELTAQRFVNDPFAPGERLYRTGDLAAWRADGTIEFHGRADDQIKLRGFRIELGEIEAQLMASAELAAASVIASDIAGDRRLVAYVVPRAGAGFDLEATRARLASALPSYMLPSAIVVLDRLPMTPNGKLDRRALPAPSSPSSPSTPMGGYLAPDGELERAIAQIWADVLGIERIGVHDNFFDAGGNSLLLMVVRARLEARLGRPVPVAVLFQHAQVRSLSAYLARQDVAPSPAAPAASAVSPDHFGTPAAAHDRAIAVIGMALRVPGASDIRTFWANLMAGIESISIAPAPAGQLAAAGLVDGIDQFDAGLFGYPPGEAAETDPQHRMFLECAWTALESAGYAPRAAPLRAGVYAGAAFSGYLLSNLLPAARARGTPLNHLGFGADFLASRVAYKLGLTGPAVAVQTACSTSLVAIHLACQALIAGECDLALAGGARIGVPQREPYTYHEGGILSADGHCRAFDVRSTGTVGGNGAAVVVLKRLADAIADRDPIHAIVLGTAINNDGNAKAGYAAPSVDGQAAVIRKAQAIAGVAPADISYVEAHGTGTPLGDPIEIAALKQVFAGVAPGACGIGTVKTNLGHLDAAAGVTGFIKAVLALEHRSLPASLHFTAPNPRLELDGSPFAVVGERRAWTSPRPLRAGVSAFGIGGTNAHVVLQEPPAITRAPAPSGDELIVVSARTRGALDRASDALAEVLRGSAAPLADLAHTLQVGRTRFAARRYAVGRDPRAIAAALSADAAATGSAAVAGTTVVPAGDRDDRDDRDAVFAFPGGGVQRVHMAAALRGEPAFRAAFDDCAERAVSLIGVDLRRVVYPDAARDVDAMAQVLDRPIVSQAAIFTCNWAIAQLWRAWGVTPRALIGHSLGEYTAACVAGVFSLDDALRLVVARGEILDRLPDSGMVSVLASPAQLAHLLDGGLTIAAVNGPATCVVAGPAAAIAGLEHALRAAGIDHRRLRYARAGHTPLLEPHLDDFERRVRSCARHAPNIPIVSTLTGGWLSAAQATDPVYWRRQLRDTVQFSDALDTLLASGRRTIIEAGPAATLSALIRRHPAAARHPVVTTVPQAPASRPALAALGDAWVAGVAIDWQRLRGDQRRHRVMLPTYSFDHQRYWIDPPGEPAPELAPKLDAATPSAAGAPRSDTERALLACFRELFGMPDLGIHDDFFQLGGDSLLAMRLVSSISRTLATAVALRTITEAPSVAALAERICPRDPAAAPPAASVADAARADGGLVRLQSGARTGPPIFLVPGLGGHVMGYRDLARAIDPARTVYGLEAQGLDRDEPLHTSVEAMASHHVSLARAAHPGGPYLLVGVSFGGTVAYEMARQLSAADHEVPLCALVDAPCPGQLPEPHTNTADLIADLFADLFAGRGTLSADVLRGLPLDDQVAHALDAARSAGIALPFDEIAQGRRLISVWHNSERAFARYTAPAWPDGEVQFFAPTDPHPRFPPHLEQAWIGRCIVRIDVTAGDHLTMVQPPHAAALGARIRRCLDAGLRAGRARPTSLPGMKDRPADLGTP